MRKSISIAALLLTAVLPFSVKSQYSITTVNTPQTINFTGFTGAGFDPAPTAGQLNSDEWDVRMASEGAVGFGGTQVSQAFANGVSGVAVPDSGVYGFITQPTPANVGLGVKLDELIDSTSFVLRFQNNTGLTINTVRIGFDWGYLNSTDASIKGAFYYSNDDLSYTPGGNTLISDTLLDASPNWRMSSEQITLNNLGLADGATYFLRWEFNEDITASAPMNGDEVVIDNISIEANVPVLSFKTISISEDESQSLEVTVHCDYSDINETAVALDLGTVGATATAGTDFTYNQLAPDTAKFIGDNPPDVTFTIPVFDDLISEPDEIFELYLNNPTNGAQIEPTKDTALFTIIDNDKIRVSFEIASSNDTEGSGITHKIVGVATNNIDSTTVEINFGGTANALDYSATGQNIANKFEFVGAGTVTDTLEIVVTDDAISEGDETVTLELVNPDNRLSLTVEVDPTKKDHLFTIHDNELAVISFVNATEEFDEDGGTLNVELRRTDAGVSSSSVDVSLKAGGTALAGTDFTFSATQTVTFSGGEGEIQTVSIPVVNDALVEGEEYFILELINEVDATLLTSEDSIVLVDDDSPELNFKAPNFIQTEGQTVQVVVGLKAAHPTQDVTCGVRRTGGDALVGTDFVDNLPQYVTFPAGDNTDQSFTIDLLDDSDIENTEFIDLEIFDVTNGTVGIDNRASVNIEDNDEPVVEFAVIDQNIFEGEGSAKVAVTISQANPSQDVEVDVVLIGGSATEGADYDYATTQRVTFPANTNDNQRVIIAIIDDVIPEPNEQISLRLENVSAGASIGSKSTHGITIFDNDQTQVSFVIVEDTVSEDVGTYDVVVEVLNPSSSVPTTVDVVAGAGTADAGADFTFANQTLTWNPGETNPQKITVPIADDANREMVEEALFELENVSSNAIIGERRMRLAILDNDTSTVQFTAATQAELEDVVRIFVSVELLNPSADLDTKATISLVGGTAIEGVDFDYPASQEITFEAGGSAIQTIAIPVNDDADYEGDEWFNLQLTTSDPTVLLGQDTQVDTIIDNEIDPTPILSFRSTSIGVDEGAGYLDVEVAISQAIQDTVGVDVVLVNGTATEGVDFTYPATKHVTFERNSTASQEIRIPILEDFDPEGNEDFSLHLVNPTNGAILSGGNDTLTQVTIQDNDTIAGPYITFNTGVLDVDESVTNPPVTMHMIGASTCIVQTTVEPLNATQNVDFLGGQGTRVFTANTADQALTLLTVIDDILIEETESFIIRFEINSGACAVGPYDSVLVNIIDNDGGSGVQFDYDLFTVTEVEDTIRLGVVVDTTYLLNCEVDVILQNQLSTAELTVDYDYPVSQHFVFNGLQDSLQYFDLILHDDLILEPTETVIFTLENVSGGLGCVLGERDTLVVEIQDDEIPVKEYTISQINGVDAMGFADSVGVECELKGVVHGYNLDAADYSFFFLDQTGGILVSGPVLPEYTTAVEGDSLHILGTVKEYNGMLLFRPIEIEVVGTGSLRAHVAVADLDESVQGLPVQVNCIELKNASEWKFDATPYTANFSSATGDVGVQVEGLTNFDPSVLPEGKVNVKGFVLQDDNSIPHTGGYRIIPMETGDLEAVLKVDFTFIVSDHYVEYDGVSDGAVVVSWDFGDGVGVDNNLKSGYEYTDAGFYQVTLTVTDENGCSVSITKEVEIEEVIIIGLEEEIVNQPVAMYPNPTRGSVYFSKAVEDIQVQDLNGRTVLEGSGKSLDVSTLSTGVYWIQAQDKSGTRLRFKLIRE